MCQPGYDRASSYVRVNVELSKRRPSGGRVRAIDATAAATSLANALVVTPSTGPDAARPMRRQFDRSVLVGRKDEAASLPAVVVNGGEEPGVDLLVAVIDHVHVGTGEQ